MNGTEIRQRTNARCTEPDYGKDGPFGDPEKILNKGSKATGISAYCSNETWWQSFSRSVKSIKMPELHLKNHARKAWKSIRVKAKSLRDFLIKPFKNLNLLRTTKLKKIKVAAVAGMIIGAPLGPAGMALGASLLIGYAAAI